MDKNACRKSEVCHMEHLREESLEIEMYAKTIGMSHVMPHSRRSGAQADMRAIYETASYNKPKY